MAVSLNAVNKPICYDTRIDYYIDLYKFAGELILSFRLPVLLSNLNECYCVVTEENSFQHGLLHGKRKVVIAGTRNWISDVEKTTTDLSITNVNCFTSLVIAIEIKKKEIPGCIQLFSTEVNELTRISESILQNALEIALYRYNEKASGASFLIPSYSDCDRIDIGFVINYIEKRFHRCHFIPFHFPLIGVSETPIDKESFAGKVHNWRYFLSKSRYEYKTKKYIDSIISSAISIESYAWEIVKSFCNGEEEIENYTTEVVEQGIRPLSATKLYKKLRDDDKLNTTLSKTMLEKYVQTILNPRNDIMHGKKTVAMPWSDIADKSQSTLIEFYEKLNEPVDEDFFHEKVAHKEETGYRQFVLKCRNGMFDSVESMRTESEAMITMYPEMELPRIQHIKALIEMGLLDDAEKSINSFFQTCYDPCSAAVDFCPSIIKAHHLDFGIRILSRIDSRDERASIALALLYLYKYRENKDRKLLNEAIKHTNVVSFNGTRYVLADIIRREIAIELGAKEQEETITAYLARAIKNDYWFSLACTEHALSKHDYTSAISYFTSFIERFSQNEHIGLRIDYYSIRYDIQDISKRANSIMLALDQVKMLSSIPPEIINKLDEAIKKNRSTFLIVTDISSKEKGEMPMGNLLYKELPFVPEGHFLYK